MQNLAGFDAGKQYWLQLHVNARAGPGGIPEASVTFDGMTLVPTTPVGPVDAVGEATAEYVFVNVPFVPNNAAGDLDISVDDVTGDAALILDGVAVIQRDPSEVVVQNPSFEASGLSTDWRRLSWQHCGMDAQPGGTGINPASDGSAPFADNGIVPDGRDVGICAEWWLLDQLIAGFEVGQQYVISFAYNARAFDNGADLAGHLNVTLGNELILDTDVDPVDAAGVFDSPYHQHASVFTATDESMSLALTHSGPEGGDETVLLDSISIRLIPEPASIALFGLGGLLLALIGGGGVELSANPVYSRSPRRRCSGIRSQGGCFFKERLR